MKLSLKPYMSDARQIKGELGADAVSLVFMEDDENPQGLCIMAEYHDGPNKRNWKYFAHTEPLPLRVNWMARAVANLRFSRERA